MALKKYQGSVKLVDKALCWLVVLTLFSCEWAVDGGSRTRLSMLNSASRIGRMDEKRQEEMKRSEGDKEELKQRKKNPSIKRCASEGRKGKEETHEYMLWTWPGPNGLCP